MDLGSYKLEIKESKLRSQRDEYIQKFLEKINPSRVSAGYKPMTEKEFVGRVKRAFDNADTGVLYLLYKKCEGFRDFGKGFNYLTRKQ
jgi:hypothetical protein